MTQPQFRMAQPPVIYSSTVTKSQHGHTVKTLSYGTRMLYHQCLWKILPRFYDVLTNIQMRLAVRCRRHMYFH